MGQASLRRDFLKTGAAAFTTSLFTGSLCGANDRPAIAFIGCGRMGSANLQFAARAGAEIAAVCEADPPALERAVAQAGNLGFRGIKACRDFREILADRSIDAVSIATPDDRHAEMTIEACKTGKDVWCEPPACLYIEDGIRMVEAARQYRRVVQAGTVRRSGGFFRKAREIIKSGTLGEVAYCRTAGYGVDSLDFVQFAFDEAMPSSISAQGGKTYTAATYRYPGFVAAYERGDRNRGGTIFHGADATLLVNRDGYWIWRARGAQPVEARTAQAASGMAEMNVPHWINFLECLRTRYKPVSDIETCVRSTVTSLLSDLALRHGATLDWDDHSFTWKLEV